MVDMDITQIRRKVRPVLKEHQIKKAGVFGSAARGEMHKGSDIDILVEIGRKASLLDLVRLKLEMEKALGKRVDLVEYGTIKAPLRKQILAEEVALI